MTQCMITSRMIRGPDVATTPAQVRHWYDRLNQRFRRWMDEERER